MKRKPLSLAVKFAITGALAGTLVACGGGGSGGGSASTGTASSGTSVGAVTGFGSVYVNGIHFNVNGTDYISDDGIEQAHQIEKGMIVKVEGDWDANGEGRADRITYEDTLRGRISAMTWDPATRTGTLTMLGQTVALDGSTVFRGATPVELGDSLATYRVRVSAWRQNDGSFLASFVGAKNGSDFADPNSNDTELEGVVTNLDALAETFFINDHEVNYTSAVGDDDFSLANLQEGMVVDVEGTLSTDGGTLNAAEIGIEDDWFNEDDGDAEISGTVSGYDAANRQFLLNGVSVQVAGNTRFEGLVESSLVDGVVVKVEGSYQNGVLLADEIKGRDSDAELDGRIDQVVDGDTFIVSGVTVNITNNTLIDDDDDRDDGRRSQARDIESLQLGDYLQIEGRQVSTGAASLEAVSIELEDSDENSYSELQAKLDDVGSGFISIMGLEIQLGNFSVSGAQVGDYVEVKYMKDAGQYVLTRNVSVDSNNDDNSDD